jgi:hypothetical protein
MELFFPNGLKSRRKDLRQTIRSFAISEIAKKKTKKRNERPESNAKKMTRLIFWASNVATLAAPFMDTV